jgi:hypothetical protein
VILLSVVVNSQSACLVVTVIHVVFCYILYARTDPHNIYTCHDVDFDSIKLKCRH